MTKFNRVSRTFTLVRPNFLCNRTPDKIIRSPTTTFSYFLCIVTRTSSPIFRAHPSTPSHSHHPTITLQCNDRIMVYNRARVTRVPAGPPNAALPEGLFNFSEPPRPPPSTHILFIFGSRRIIGEVVGGQLFSKDPVCVCARRVRKTIPDTKSAPLRGGGGLEVSIIYPSKGSSIRNELCRGYTRVKFRVTTGSPVETYSFLLRVHGTIVERTCVPGSC